MPAGVSDAITSMTTIIGTVVTTITGNPILAIFLGAALLGSGIALFRKLRKA